MANVAPWLVPNWFEAMTSGASAGLQLRSIEQNRANEIARLGQADAARNQEQQQSADRLRLAYDQLAQNERMESARLANQQQIASAQIKAQNERSLADDLIRSQYQLGSLGLRESAAEANQAYRQSQAERLSAQAELQQRAEDRLQSRESRLESRMQNAGQIHDLNQRINKNIEANAKETGTDKDTLELKKTREDEIAKWSAERDLLEKQAAASLISSSQLPQQSPAAATTQAQPASDPNNAIRAEWLRKNDPMRRVWFQGGEASGGGSNEGWVPTSPGSSWLMPNIGTTSNTNKIKVLSIEPAD